MPSMIEAWFSASETTASSGPSSGSNRPPLASKQAANRIVSSLPRKRASRVLQRPVQVLRAADEAHARHAVAVVVHRGLRGGDQGGVIGEAEVVVGAEVQHVAPVGGDGDMPALGRDDGALGLPQPLGPDRIERVGNPGQERL
jgi:hypothetical protein